MKELPDPTTFVGELRRIGPDAMVNYYLLEGVPAFFKGNWELYCEFKRQIADGLGVHPKTVMLVGSGRWGFSTSPDKFGHLFDEGARSDLDVVVADSALFDRAWRELCEYEMDDVAKGAAVGHVTRRRNMLYEGRLDPAEFPPQMRLRDEWHTFFAELSRRDWNSQGLRKVGAWMFRDWRFVQRYYRRAFRAILDKAGE